MMWSLGNQKELQRSFLGTQAHGSQKNRVLSLKVSCVAGRRYSCKTSRCCNYLTLGFASSVKRTSLILFRCCAEACRASTQLHAAACLRRFSADARKALKRLRTSHPSPTLPSKLHCRCSIKSSVSESPHDLSERALATVATRSWRR